jgi:NAD(P)H dehydrogenase (quinone)
MEKRRTKADRKAETRSALIGAARQLFTEHGYAATATEEVVRDAGASRGALYHLFRDKEELFRGVYEDVDREVVGEIVAAAQGQQNAWDRLVVGCPTYMGSGSAALKAFMEETLQPRFLEQRWKDKLAAGFMNSAGMSGDKLLSLQQLAGFAAQHGMIWVTLGQLPGCRRPPAAPRTRTASFLGLMSQSNADQGPDEAPPPSDRATAERFGRRIGEATHRWARGGAFAAVATS